MLRRRNARPWPAPIALLALALWAAGCGGDTTNANSQDSGRDVPQDSGSLDTGSLDTGSLDTGSLDVGQDIAMDVPPDLAMDVPRRCTANADCAGDPRGAACDLTTGACVQCVASLDTCPASQHCDDASHTCVAGCRSDEGCAAGDAGTDGGTAGARCDPTTHACVACVTDAHCAPGQLCVGNTCVAGCNESHPCATGQTCCTGACVDTLSNTAHCGRCDARCAAPNATPACMNGACAVGACTAPFADCNTTASDGCEVNTQTTTNHCGRCGNACPTRAHATTTCAAGACGFTCEAGYADCDGDATNGCEAALATDPTRCGACTTACDLANATAGCAAGRCTVASCREGFGDCDGNATNGCEADTRTAVSHCGRCGNACPAYPNGAPSCVLGACRTVCTAGWAECNGDATDGCEVDTTASASHCGGCGRACSFAHASARCAAGTCALGACDTGYGDCDGAASNGCEVDTRGTPAHCGACGRACSVEHGTPGCAAGACTVASCEAGFGDCDGNPSNGCETATTTEVAHCGACGNACPTRAHATTTCAAGACGFTCEAGYADCNGDASDGCEVDTRASASHCGACGQACCAGNRCSVGACTPGCAPGWSPCPVAPGAGCLGGTCHDLATDASNCGACGRACEGGRVCVAGACAAPVTTGCAELHRAAPTLPSGVYSIDPDGSGGRAAFNVYCDMTTDGGGWTYGAIVRTSTSSSDRTRVAGVTAFGAPTATLADNEYSVDLTGVTFSEVRIDNFTDRRAVRRSTSAPVTWDTTTYRSSGNFVSKRITLAGGYEFRVGYYLPGYCALDRVNLPMCFTSASNPVGWVCDTDSGFIEGWGDQTGGEGCGLPYCSVFFRDTTCTSYVSRVAVYGFAVR